MIAGRDILVLSDDPEGLPSSTQHLFRYLGPHNRIFWLNVLNRLPGPSWDDAWKIARVSAGWLRRRRMPRGQQPPRPRTAPYAYAGTPPIIPWFKPAVRRWNGAVLGRHYRRLVRQYDIRDAIVFTTYPSTVDFVRDVSAAAKVYCCVDEWSQYPGLNAADFRRMEDELLGCVDGFAATSPDLMDKGRRCPAALYLPHGVDFSHFQGDPGGARSIAELAGLPRPIVGFFGLIAPWVDLELVAHLSRRFPNVSFVLLGKVEANLAPLARCANVHCLGLVPYRELPNYARYFDVGLIPFVRNELTEAVNPLKLLEYFALGLPVLATRVRALEGREGPLRLATTRDEFCEQLAALLTAPASFVAEAREVARRNTWERRAEQLSEFLLNLPSRGSSAITTEHTLSCPEFCT